jgi:hypothetical protein
MPYEPVQVLLVVPPLWVEPTCHFLEHVSTAPLAPTFANLRKGLVALALVDHGPHPGLEEHEPLDPVRIGGGEHRGSRRRLRPSQQRRTLDRECVHHRQDVVDP